MLKNCSFAYISMKVRENLSRPLLYINPPFSSIPPFYRNIQKHPLSSQFWDTQTPLSKGGSGLWNSLPPHQRQPEKGYVAQISPETSTKASQINKSHRKTPPLVPQKYYFLLSIDLLLFQKWTRNMGISTWNQTQCLMLYILQYLFLVMKKEG